MKELYEIDRARIVKAFHHFCTNHQQFSNNNDSLFGGIIRASNADFKEKLEKHVTDFKLANGAIFSENEKMQNISSNSLQTRMNELNGELREFVRIINENYSTEEKNKIQAKLLKTDDLLVRALEALAKERDSCQKVILALNDRFHRERELKMGILAELMARKKRRLIDSRLADEKMKNCDQQEKNCVKKLVLLAEENVAVSCSPCITSVEL